jgi:hypothetical protein
VLRCVQDTVVAIRKGGTDLHVANLDGVRFGDIHFTVDPSQVLSLLSSQ